MVQQTDVLDRLLRLEEQHVRLQELTLQLLESTRALFLTEPGRALAALNMHSPGLARRVTVTSGAAVAANATVTTTFVPPVDFVLVAISGAWLVSAQRTFTLRINIDNQAVDLFPAAPMIDRPHILFPVWLAAVQSMVLTITNSVGTIQQYGINLDGWFVEIHAWNWLRARLTEIGAPIAAGQAGAI